MPRPRCVQRRRKSLVYRPATNAIHIVRAPASATAVEIPILTFRWSTGSMAPRRPPPQKRKSTAKNSSWAGPTPEGSRPHLGALLLAYYAPDGRLVYAGRAGTGMPVRELARLAARLKPLATARMPLDVPPPRGSRLHSPLVLSRVHWVRPELVSR
jgi:hypothetical protein